MSLRVEWLIKISGAPKKTSKCFSPSCIREAENLLTALNGSEFKIDVFFLTLFYFTLSYP